MNNIFQIGGQVSGESFIGRKKQLASLRRNFIETEARTAKAIVGLTRVGKTSLVKNSLHGCPENVIYIYVNLNECYSYNNLWEEICCFNILEELKKRGIQTDSIAACFEAIRKEDVPWLQMSRSIKKIFAFLAEIPLKTIMVLDEFDNASTLFNEGTRHFELFRTIFSDGDYHVSAITISRRNLYTIEGATYQSSTFRGVFDLMRLKGFDASEMEAYFEIFASQGISLNEEQKAQIVYYAGNMPYLLSIMGHHIIETAMDGEPLDIDKIFLEKCVMINTYYEDCIRYLEEDGDLKRILPFVVGPNIGVTQSDKDELRSMGYFQEVDGKEIVISEYFMAFLTVQMTMQGLSVSIWDNLIRLEKKLKELVKRELPRIVRHCFACGEDEPEVWESIMRATPYIFDRDISRYQSFIRNTMRDFRKQVSYLDVMSMNDVVKIINACWNDIFSPYFDNAQQRQWKDKFQQCVRARNPIAHGHEEYLEDKDRQKVDKYCKQIFDLLARTKRKTKPEKTPFLEEAKKNNLEDALVGNIVDMRTFKVGEISSHTVLRGTYNKYQVIIPTQYLKERKSTELFEKLRDQFGKTMRVKLKCINRFSYMAQPIVENEVFSPKSLPIPSEKV